eukprot:CAMPEP_0179002506 /NCGR_PEP_ID=MMETSP0795-20121207/12067_1 /TAXON_ID=88552 /ORGANISM="Amoebophrya sp., Strain Ameob2" /LENGTH=725 /DNA_ID=CAMNT_0020696225 /DNA_START=801 /DNA_END=2975 /DNA_ORIENTATION=-
MSKSLSSAGLGALLLPPIAVDSISTRHGVMSRQRTAEEDREAEFFTELNGREEPDRKGLINVAAEPEQDAHASQPPASAAAGSAVPRATPIAENASASLSYSVPRAQWSRPDIPKWLASFDMKTTPMLGPVPVSAQAESMREEPGAGGGDQLGSSALDKTRRAAGGVAPTAEASNSVNEAESWRTRAWRSAPGVAMKRAAKWTRNLGAQTAKAKSVTNGLSNGASDTEASGEGLQWLNLFMETLWPRVKEYAKPLKDDLEAALKEKSKGSIKIVNFSLGDDAPVLVPVHAYQEDKQDVKGFEVDVSISWRPTVDISLSVLGIPVGLKGLVIEGSLSLAFRPLMDTLPLVGGMQIFMINPPAALDLDFNGVARVANAASLRDTIRNTISGKISDFLVLPNLHFIPFGDVQTKIDFDVTRLYSPRPEAVLRLQLHRAHNLFAKDFSFFGHATSDPYAIAKIGARTFRSRTVPATLNPIWDDSDPKNPGYSKHPPAVYDFFMFNKRQFLNLELFDHDMSKDDKLGNVKLQVGELAIQGGREVAIPLTQDDGDVKGGDVAVSVKTMKMIPIKTIEDVPSIRWMVPADALKSPVKQSKSKGSVAPKRNLHNVMLLQCRLASVRGIPKKFERDKVNVQFSIPSEDPKDLKRSGGGQQKEVSALVGDAVPHAMQAMIENLSLGTDKVRRLTVAELAHFAHYPPEVIAEILKRRPSFDCVFNYGCHFLVTDPM